MGTKNSVKRGRGGRERERGRERGLLFLEYVKDPASLRYCSGFLARTRETKDGRLIKAGLGRC